MKRKTLLCLDEFIIKGLYDGFVNKPFITLFKNYADKEIKNVNDFLLVAETYVKFVYANKEDLISRFPFLNEQDIRCDLNEIASVINSLKFNEHQTTLKNYTKMIEYFINKKTRVLDVGAGAFPLSSMVLAKKNKNVSAMDNFIVSEEFLRERNVEPKNGFFTERTNISDYDMVVGLRPCNAIGQIVEVCKKENKPYFLHLCNCGATDYALSKFRVMAGNWRQILPEIDNNIKFANVYATNLDISQEKLNKIVFRKCRLTKEMRDCGMLSFMQGFSMVMDSLAKGEELEVQTDSGVVSSSIVNCVAGDWKLMNDEKSLGEE